MISKCMQLEAGVHIDFHVRSEIIFLHFVGLYKSLRKAVVAVFYAFLKKNPVYKTFSKLHDSLLW